MDAELIRQAEHLFGGSMNDRRSATNASSGRPSGAPAEAQAAQTAAEPAADSEPPLVKLNLTSKQQRRLWKHVESIENFWETLQEIEPGTVKRLARLALDRR